MHLADRDDQSNLLECEPHHFGMMRNASCLLRTPETELVIPNLRICKTGFAPTFSQPWTPLMSLSMGDVSARAPFFTFFTNWIHLQRPHTIPTGKSPLGSTNQTMAHNANNCSPNQNMQIPFHTKQLLCGRYRALLSIPGYTRRSVVIHLYL